MSENLMDIKQTAEYLQMNKITLDDVIKEQLDTDPEFADYYQTLTHHL